MFFELGANTGTVPGHYLASNAATVEAALATAWPAVAVGRFAPAVPHAIFAALWERTGVVEVVRAVLADVLGDGGAGLTLPALTWAQTTESLVFKEAPPYSVLSVTSAVRPRLAEVRAATYRRLFGSFGANGDGGGPSTGHAFSRLLDDLLTQGLIGAEHRGNSGGRNPTRPGQLAEAARGLHEMLAAARPAGLAMSREEFVAVAILGWMELTLATNSPILVDLGATGATPAQRLERLAARVGMELDGLPVADVIVLARPMSNLLRMVETGALDTPATAPALYVSAPARATVETIGAALPRLAATGDGAAGSVPWLVSATASASR